MIYGRRGSPLWPQIITFWTVRQQIAGVHRSALWQLFIRVNVVTLTALFLARTMQEAPHVVEEEVIGGRGLLRKWSHLSKEEGNVMTNDECWGTPTSRGGSKPHKQVWSKLLWWESDNSKQVPDISLASKDESWLRPTRSRVIWNSDDIPHLSHSNQIKVSGHEKLSFILHI